MRVGDFMAGESFALRYRGPDGFARRDGYKRLLARGMETEAHVIGDPISNAVAKDRLEEFYGSGDHGGAIFGLKMIEHSIAERVEPRSHAVL